MMIRRVMPAVALAVLTMLSCSRGQASGAGAKDDGAAFYTMETATVTVAPGQKGALIVTIKPKPGFKWNDEFPVSLAVAKADAGLVKFTKTSIKRGDPEIEASHEKATLSLPLEGATAGHGELDALVTFSVCNDKACHVFRKKPVKATVTVQ